MDEDTLIRVKLKQADVVYKLKNFLVFIQRHKDIFIKIMLVFLALWYLEYYKNSILDGVKAQSDKTVSKIRYSIKKAGAR